MASPLKKFVFDQVLADAIKAGKGQFNSDKSMNWFRTKIKNYGISKASLITEAESPKRTRLDVLPGSMYFFSYDPKLKDELPFYDAFPLIFVVDRQKDGFTGLNLHYLSPQYRQALMRQLFEYASNDALTPRTKLKFSYGMLKSASKMPLYKPCFKKYLIGHTRSKFISILPAEWTSALFLPVADFKKKSEDYVWRWSRSKF